MASFVERGGLWVLTQGVLMLSVFILGIIFRAAQSLLFLHIAGIILLAACGFVGIAGVLALRKQCTPFPKPGEDFHLVQTGIYAHIRHPLYTSVILGCFGWAALWHSFPAAAVSVLLIPFFAAKAKREEQWLRQLFPNYNDYQKRVPAFLPGPRS